MKHHKFNNDFMNTLIDKLTVENKPSVNSGDFNLNLIKCTQNSGVNFISHITLPTKVAEKSSTFIENIFTNNYEHNCVSGISQTTFHNF